MRLKREVLKNYCKGPLSRIMYLNLSNLDIDIIERLNKCEHLHWFIARNNNFQSDEGIKHLKQLWHLDISNNKIQHLTCLNQFLALGTLILSNNDLKWQDLQRIRHAHIMSLSLHGNPQLDADPYYRIHVIDSLPLIWELDGRLVTVTERLHVKQFFVDTQYTEHPVRHKVSKPFQTSALKNIGTEGIVSDECKYIFSKFPVSETHTKHTDERRFTYLTRMVQEDLNRFMFEQDVKRRLPNDFLEMLMQERSKNVEKCNMVLLLLVISLEFHLPTSLVRAALVRTELDMIGAVNIMSYFLLPREFRTRIIGLLLNAAKLDRDNKLQSEGGLYAQLFMCIYYTVAQLTKISQTSHSNMQKIKPMPHNSDYMALMASEVVSLLLTCPQLFGLISTEPGVVALISAATGNLDVVQTVKKRLLDIEQGLLDLPDDNVYDELNAIVLDAIEQRLSKINIKMGDIPIGDRYLALSDSLPIKPLHSVIWASTFLSKGQIIPRTEPPILNPEREAAKPKPLQPKMGEKVLLGPQVVGELTMLMEGEIAMVKIDAVPVANGAVVSKLKSTDAHFAFVDMKSMCYAHDLHMWRPLKTVGDKVIEDEPRYTIHSTDSRVSQGLSRPSSVLKTGRASSPLIYTPRDRQSSRQSDEQPRGRGISSSKSDRSAKHQGSANQNQSTNFSFSDKEFEQLFPEDEPNKLRPASSHTRPNTSESNRKKGTCPVINCGSWHDNDNVHYIRGLTPREDSSRSCSIAATPSDRRQPSDLSITSKSIIPMPDTAQNGRLPSTREEQDLEEKEDWTDDKEVLRLEVSQNDESTLYNKLDSQRNGVESFQEEEEDVDFSNKISDRSHTHNGVIVEDADSLANVDDNCPICVANRRGTILKTVDGDIEAVQMDGPLEITQASDKEHEEEKITTENQESNKITNAESQEPVINQVPEVKVRPKSSLPPESRRLRSGDSQIQQQISRPKSAMESYSYYVITNPPNVVAKGTKARMNDRYNNGQSLFKTDFQQQREEAWKRTTRSRRPQTAAVMTSSHIPPPQRPSSPILSRESQARNAKFKVTRTDRWLGGGRDLFWESVRKRPKSGHVPGWKEGLPESMRKKQRPVTAHSLPMPRANISRPGSTTFISACSNCSPTSYGYHINATSQASFVRGEESDRMLIMPQSQAIPQQMDLRTRVVTSPMSDENEQIFLEEPLLNKETTMSSTQNAVFWKGLFIQGVPPYTVPHPRKFTYLPSDTAFYTDDEFADCYLSQNEYHSSSYLPLPDEKLKYDTLSQFSGDFCPPPSPHDKGGVAWDADVIDYKNEKSFVTSNNGNSTTSPRYKLCSHHEKMFMKGATGNVVIYVIESGNGAL